MERDHAAGKKQHCETQNQQRLSRAKSTTRRIIYCSTVFAVQSIRYHLLSGLDSRNNFLHVAGKHAPLTTSRRLKCPALAGTGV